MATRNGNLEKRFKNLTQTRRSLLDQWKCNENYYVTALHERYHFRGSNALVLDSIGMVCMYKGSIVL
jgi:hypothetical protein